MPDGEVAVLGLRLARVDEALQDAVDVMRDRLAIEDPQHDGVRVGVRGQRDG